MPDFDLPPLPEPDPAKPGRSFGNPHWTTKRPNEVVHRPDGITEMKLTQGKTGTLFTYDYPLVCRFRWSAQRYVDAWYVSSNYPCPISPSGFRAMKMHQVIMPLDRPLEPDHIDINGLNNCRDNLRPETRSQNMVNRKQWGKTARVIGVHWCARDKMWVAQIGFQMKNIRLGMFKSEDEAIKVRKAAEEKYFPDFKKAGDALYAGL